MADGLPSNAASTNAVSSAPGAPLDGRVALVTGAGSGIGRAGALAFAQLGATVMATDLDGDTAEQTAEMILQAGGAAAAMACDITNEQDVAAMVAGTVERFGGLHAAFNNAGNAREQFPIHEMPLDEWRASVEVNLTGAFLCMKHELVHMLEAGGGAIVNTSSGAARVPAPGRSPYSAAKRGVVSLTSHIARDYAAKGIRANAVLPGLIDTPAVRRNHSPEQLEKFAGFLPGGRIGQPDDIADVAAWLCTDAARYINGQAIVVDGGGILA